jgi:hypothetical protein
VTVQIPNLTGVFCCSKKQSFRLRTLILFQPWRRAFARNNNILHIVPWRLKLRKNLSSPILKISSFWNYPAVIIKNSSSFASLELGVHKLFVYQPIRLHRRTFVAEMLHSISKWHYYFVLNSSLLIITL